MVGTLREVSIVYLPDGAVKWNLVVEFLKLRKEVFIHNLEWPLFHADEMEFEQYDSPRTHYIICHAGDKILGGARLLRTDWQHSQGKVEYSYMIRDAYNGLLPGLSAKICNSAPPVDSGVWEMTRFVSRDGEMVGEEIIKAGIKYLISIKAKKCLFLSSPAFMRVGRRMGYDAVALGPIIKNNDGKFLAFSCEL